MCEGLPLEFGVIGPIIPKLQNLYVNYGPFALENTGIQPRKSGRSLGFYFTDGDSITITFDTTDLPKEIIYNGLAADGNPICMVSPQAKKYIPVVDDAQKNRIESRFCNRVGSLAVALDAVYPSQDSIQGTV